MLTQKGAEVFAKGRRESLKVFINFDVRDRTQLFADQFKSKTLSQKMIEKFLRLGARLWQSAQANVLFNRAIDQFLLRRGGKYDIERFFGSGLIDLLET